MIPLFDRMRGRPPKSPKDRRTDSMKIPMTAAEKRLVELAAASDQAKPVTWARDVLMTAAHLRKK
jgi:hypothetical protein